MIWLNHFGKVWLIVSISSVSFMTSRVWFDCYFAISLPTSKFGSKSIFFSHPVHSCAWFIFFSKVDDNAPCVDISSTVISKWLFATEGKRSSLNVFSCGRQRHWVADWITFRWIAYSTSLEISKKYIRVTWPVV